MAIPEVTAPVDSVLRCYSIERPESAASSAGPAFAGSAVAAEPAG